jgi:hypothetical protein
MAAAGSSRALEIARRHAEAVGRGHVVEYVLGRQGLAAVGLDSQIRITR